MSLFKKPKKSAAAQRRIFSSEYENIEKMDIEDDDSKQEDSFKDKKKDKKEKLIKPQKSSLLSFGDEGNFISGLQTTGSLKFS